MRDLKGLKFNKLLVLEKANESTYAKNNYKGIHWRCICDCGNEKIVKSSHLITSNVKSCGCARNMVNFKGSGELPHSSFTRILKSAKKRKLEFSITIEYIWNLFLKQERKCAYTGQLLTLGKHGNDASKTASLDRIDSSKGYIPGNVIWCHKKINILKMNIEINEFYNLCELVTDYKSEGSIIINNIITNKNALEITTQTLIS